MTIDQVVSGMMERSGMVASRPTGLVIYLSKTGMLMMASRAVRCYARISAFDIVASDWTLQVAPAADQAEPAAG
ncbi:MAG TPA: hypothetical protein VLT57_11220 [Bryobacteraceae bacterium]|nr:hypothetical protein [Bryobacteraceae bacterium]